MKPTVGRIVHYQSHGSPDGKYKSVPRAAIVTAIREDGGSFPGAPGDGTAVDLCVLNPEGMFFNRMVFLNADGEPGTWRWPPRE